MSLDLHPLWRKDSDQEVDNALLISSMKFKPNCKICQKIFKGFLYELSRNQVCLSWNDLLDSTCSSCRQIAPREWPGKFSRLKPPLVVIVEPLGVMEPTFLLLVLVKVDDPNLGYLCLNRTRLAVVPTYPKNGLEVNTRGELRVDRHKLANAWIEECVRTHDLCNTRKSGAWYPTRLLEIADDGNRIFLRVSQDDPPEGAYIALSHCWGSVDIVCKLTNESIEVLKGGIEIENIPKLFQDVVAMTQRLGVRYLWIDSFCIIQDSREDWLKEACSMTDVYQHSYCTISTTHADSSTKPLIGPGRHASSFIEVEGMSGHKSLCSIIRIEILRQNLWNAETAPLTVRGWAFQERLLSPRVLHFGENQMLWECMERDYCESDPRGVHWDVSGPTRWVAPRRFKEPLSANPYKQWLEIVVHYSNCKLTKGTDKLLALAGIAKTFKGRIEGDYVAGIWVHEANEVNDHLSHPVISESGNTLLCHQLTWVIQNWPLATSPKPAQYRSPSWSWASVDSRVIFNGEMGEPMAKLLDYGSVNEGNDRFSQVISASLKLRGKIFPITMEQKDLGKAASLWTDFVWVLRFKEFDEPFLPLPIKWDYKDHYQELEFLVASIGTTLFVMPLAYFPTSIAIEAPVPGMMVEGLVMEKDDLDGRTVFRRVGSFEAVNNVSRVMVQASRKIEGSVIELI